MWIRSQNGFILADCLAFKMSDDFQYTCIWGIIPGSKEMALGRYTIEQAKTVMDMLQRHTWEPIEMGEYGGPCVYQMPMSEGGAE